MTISLDTDTRTANGLSGQAVKLWEHPSPKSTQLWQFVERLNKTYNLQLKSYEEAHSWSTNNIAKLWGEVWQYCGIRASQQYTEVRSIMILCVQDRLSPFG